MASSFFNLLPTGQVSAMTTMTSLVIHGVLLTTAAVFSTSPEETPPKRIVSLLPSPTNSLPSLPNVTRNPLQVPGPNPSQQRFPTTPNQPNPQNSASAVKPGATTGNSRTGKKPTKPATKFNPNPVIPHTIRTYTPQMCLASDKSKKKLEGETVARIRSKSPFKKLTKKNIQLHKKSRHKLLNLGTQEYLTEPRKNAQDNRFNLDYLSANVQNILLQNPKRKFKSVNYELTFSFQYPEQYCENIIRLSKTPSKPTPTPTPVPPSPVPQPPPSPVIPIPITPNPNPITPPPLPPTPPPTPITPTPTPPLVTPTPTPTLTPTPTPIPPTTPTPTPDTPPSPQPTNNPETETPVNAPERPQQEPDTPGAPAPINLPSGPDGNFQRAPELRPQPAPSAGDNSPTNFQLPPPQPDS